LYAGWPDYKNNTRDEPHLNKEEKRETKDDALQNKGEFEFNRSGVNCRNSGNTYYVSKSKYIQIKNKLTNETTNEERNKFTK
jgi:hypothetical protein